MANDLAEQNTISIPSGGVSAGHIVANFITTQNLDNYNKFTDHFNQVLNAIPVSIVASTGHEFDTKGFTATFVLAESHVNVHTWPEHQLVHLDILLCNYSAQNTEKLERIYSKMKEYFQPQKTNYIFIER